MLNGNTMNWLYKAFVGGGITATISLLLFMGKGIVTNEQRNVDDHRAIRSELYSSVSDLKDDVTIMRIEQVEQRGILERIEGKL